MLRVHSKTVSTPRVHAPCVLFLNVNAYSPRAPYLPPDFACLCCILCEAEFRHSFPTPERKRPQTLCVAHRLLVETEYRPARRQAAVTVANLASTLDGTMSVSLRIRPTVDLSQTGYRGLSSHTGDAEIEIREREGDWDQTGVHACSN